MMWLLVVQKKFCVRPDGLGLVSRRFALSALVEQIGWWQRDGRNRELSCATVKDTAERKNPSELAGKSKVNIGLQTMLPCYQHFS